MWESATHKLIIMYLTAIKKLGFKIHTDEEWSMEYLEKSSINLKTKIKFITFLKKWEK